MTRDESYRYDAVNDMLIIEYVMIENNVHSLQAYGVLWIWLKYVNGKLMSMQQWGWCFVSITHESKRSH